MFFFKRCVFTANYKLETMKELLKLFPILGIASFLGLSVGCGGGASDMGDDTPPAADEPYDGGGAGEGEEAGTGEGESAE